MEEEKKLPKLQPASSQKIRIEPPKKNDLGPEAVIKTSEGEEPSNASTVTAVEGEGLAAPLQEVLQAKTDTVQDKGLLPLWFGLLGVSGVMLLLTFYILMVQSFNIAPIGLLKPLMKIVGG